MRRRDFELAYEHARTRCDLPRRVWTALGDDLQPYRWRFGLCVGKSAAAMAVGIGRVEAGLLVAPHGPPRRVPEGWEYLPAAHPHPDDRSLVAGARARALLERATDNDFVVVGISGGASAMLEEPRVPLGTFRALLADLMASGVPIEELNTVRTALSHLKGGGLVLDCRARVLTLVASDIIDDRFELVGSGPTIGPWLERPRVAVEIGVLAEARRLRALAILEREGFEVPEVLRVPVPSRVVQRDDRALLVLPMRAFAEAFTASLRKVDDEAHADERAQRSQVLDSPMRGDVAVVARQLASFTAVVAYGEPTVRVPAGAGRGGRMQQLALELARYLAGTRRVAFCVASDGVDGPPLPGPASVAGAYVDGRTWAAIVAAGIDPDLALARCDAGTALDAVGALFRTTPSDINCGDLVMVATHDA